MELVTQDNADEIRAMDRDQLIAQAISNNGGVYVLETLLKIGVTAENVDQLLASLKYAMFVVAETQQAKGYPVTGIKNSY